MSARSRRQCAPDCTVDCGACKGRPDLTAEVVATMARLNTSIGPDDPPYPASLTPIAEAVIAVVVERVAIEERARIANLLDTWEFPPGSDALEPMYRLVQRLRAAAHIARTEKP